MKIVPFRKLLGAVSAVIPLLIAACADPAGPSLSSLEATTPEVRALLSLNLTSKHAVEWAATHSGGTYSVSGVISSKGGSLAIPASDFTITFAPGAVSASTSVTVTSLSGKYVAYDMLPHGIRFAAPVTVTQGLRNTAVFSHLNLLTGLTGTYVNNDTPPAADGTFVPTELLQSATYLVKDLLGNLVPDKQTWQLNHFSRYMLASG